MLRWLFGRLSFKSYWSVYIACSKGLRHGDANHLFNSWTTGMPLKLVWIRIWSRQRTSDRWSCSFYLAVCMGSSKCNLVLFIWFLKGNYVFIKHDFKGWLVSAQVFRIHFSCIAHFQLGGCGYYCHNLFYMSIMHENLI